MTEDKRSLIKRLAQEYNVDQAMGDPLEAMAEAYDSGYRARDAEVAALRQALQHAHTYFIQNNDLTFEDREMLDEMWVALAQTKPATKETTK
jgi:Skp family chaperone for outer membrane proteins